MSWGKGKLKSERNYGNARNDGGDMCSGHMCCFLTELYMGGAKPWVKVLCDEGEKTERIIASNDL